MPMMGGMPPQQMALPQMFNPMFQGMGMQGMPGGMGQPNYGQQAFGPMAPAQFNQDFSR